VESASEQNVPIGLPPPAGARWKTDWKAGQRFLVALFGLGFALFLAMEATALRQAGRYGLSAGAALAALVLSGMVAVRAVPYLARRTVFGRLMGRIEVRFTSTGLIYLLAVAALSLAAVNTGNNLLYILLASLLAALIVSGVVSRLTLAGIEVELELPEHVFARQPTPVRLAVRNRKRHFASFAVTVTSTPPKLRVQSAPETLKRTAFPLDPVYWDYLPRQSARVRKLQITVPTRGVYVLDGIRVSTRFPFGLLVKSRRTSSKRQVIVLPSVEPTAQFGELLPLVSGEVETMAKGRGHDLYSIRDYRPNDLARHVDWKATARTQQLKVREFTREDERQVILILDAHLMRGDAPELERFERAVDVCACMAWHFYGINAELQFVTQGYETRLARAAEVIYPVLECLAQAEPRQSGGADLLGLLPASGSASRIVLTPRPHSSIPAALWSTSTVFFFDAL
jgi:uncharacterized protein (DUF58 family)